MTWAINNFGLILELTLIHLRHSLIPLAVGFALSIPLGWLAWRFALVRGPILVVTGLLYTIPSIALLTLLPTALGIPIFSEANLLIALTLYAIALLVRSVADGLDSVDSQIRLAATGMGYGGFRRFFAIELPLAGPVILSGLRVAAVSTVSLATVGVLAGVTNLGYLFADGYSRRIPAEILSGVVATVIIALVIDVLLALLGRIVMPWTRATQTRGTRRRVAEGADA